MSVDALVADYELGTANGSDPLERGDWDYDGDNDELLTLLREDSRFAALYDDGAGPGDDHSNLDWALVCSIAELTGDPDRIEKIWQGSALWREEGPGEKHSYGWHDRTIRNAIGRVAAERFESPRLEVMLPDDGYSVMPGLPDYPEGIFTGAAEAQFEEMRHGGLPLAFAGAALLAAGATALGNSTYVDLDGMVQYPGLWIPIVGGVSSGKTPALDVVMAPVREINSRHATLYQEDLAAWMELSADEKKTTPRPTRFSLTVQDVTVESLARTLAKQHGTVAVVADELGGFVQSLGQYKQGHSSDRDRVLSLWAQQPWEYTRVGSSNSSTNSIEIYIPKPVVVIAGTLQFERIALLGSGSDGMRARWLLHAANPVPPTTTPARTLDVWREHIEELHNARWLEVANRHWELTDAASRRFYEQRAAWSQGARELGQTPKGGALGKADTHCLRVALILAELDHPGTSNTRIPLDTIERAISVVDFSAACWADQSESDALSLTHKDAKLDEAVDKMRAWLRGRGWVKERELRRACVAGARTKTAQQELFSHYYQTYPESCKDGSYRA